MAEWAISQTYNIKISNKIWQNHQSNLLRVLKMDQRHRTNWEVLFKKSCWILIRIVGVCRFLLGTKILGTPMPIPSRAPQSSSAVEAGKLWGSRLCLSWTGFIWSRTWKTPCLGVLKTKVILMANKQGRTTLQLAWNPMTDESKQQTYRPAEKLIWRSTEWKWALTSSYSSLNGMEGCINSQSCAHPQERLDKALARYFFLVSMRPYKHRKQNLWQSCKLVGLTHSPNHT